MPCFMQILFMPETSRKRLLDDPRHSQKAFIYGIRLKPVKVWMVDMWNIAAISIYYYCIYVFSNK